MLPVLLVLQWEETCLGVDEESDLLDRNIHTSGRGWRNLEVPVPNDRLTYLVRQREVIKRAAFLPRLAVCPLASTMSCGSILTRKAMKRGVIVSQRTRRLSEE